MEKISGIYCIENIVNGKKYIGKSNNIYKRWYEEKLGLKKKYESILAGIYSKG